METIAEAQETFKTIQLTQGQVALVDADDYERVNSRKWYAAWARYTKTFYARSGHRPQITMQHFVMGMKQSSTIRIDHRNGNTLDNRKRNLRIASPAQNAQNRKAQAKWAAKHSLYKGVTWAPDRNKWRAMIRVGGVLRMAGQFDDEEEAAQAYNEAAMKHFGEFARLNEVGDDVAGRAGPELKFSGVEKLVSRMAHNHENAGSSPAPAT